MIDPLGPRPDALARAVSAIGPGTAVPRVDPLAGVRTDVLTTLLAGGAPLSPVQSQQIVALVRATLESFAAPVPEGQSTGSLEAFHAAQVSLGRLQEDLATRLTRMQDQSRSIAPILDALLEHGPPSRTAQMTARPGSPTTSPGSPATPQGTPSVASLAQSLAEASARLEETLTSAMLSPALSARDTRPPNPFRWLHEAARTLPTGPARPVITPGEVVRLTSLAHALVEALATPLPPAAPRTGDVVRRIPPQGPPQRATPAPVAPVADDPLDPEDAFPLQGDMFIALDRHPGVAPLLTPILRELGLAVATAQLAPGAMSAEVFAAAIARVQLLAVIVLAEAGGVAAPGVYHDLLAKCLAAGMPPFTMPLDSADNIEAYRWLLIAAQLYNQARVAPRPPVLTCHRCGRTLRRSRTGIYYCLYCP